MDANEHELLIATANHANDADERIVGSLSSLLGFMGFQIPIFNQEARNPGMER